MDTHTTPQAAAAPAPAAPAAPRRGRPPKGEQAQTPAQRQQAYRDRLAARRAELADPRGPLRSQVIDLSAIPPWRR